MGDKTIDSKDVDLVALWANKRRDWRCSRASRKLSETERFWEKVDKNGPTAPGMDSPCWLWVAARLPDGYGNFSGGYKKFGTKIASRASWIMANGPVPGGLLVCHRCDQPLCVNHAHLFLGTALDNRRDAVAKGRMLAGFNTTKNTNNT